MIYLHLGEDAGERIDALAAKAEGDVFRLDLRDRQMLDPDRIASWIANSAKPALIAVTGCRAGNRGERRAFESLRRMAKLRGLDVHLAGDASLQPVADHLVEDDEALPSGADRTTSAQVAEFIRSEKMEPFQRAEMDIPSVREAMAAMKMTEAEATQHIRWMKSQSVWINNLYQVNIEYLPDDRAHLIIRRIDKQPIHNWVHFQQIKNELLGAECEAVEIYPKESRLVDAKHHYHLWGFRKPHRSFGVGFTERQVASGE